MPCEFHESCVCNASHEKSGKVGGTIFSRSLNWEREAEKIRPPAPDFVINYKNYIREG